MASHRIDPDYPISVKSDSHFLKTAGLVLICSGLAFGLDQELRTGWLTLLVIPFVSLFGFVSGVRLHRMSWVIPSALTGGLGFGLFAIFSRFGDFLILFRIGLFLLGFGLSWVGIFLASLWLSQWKAWWAIVPGFVIGGASLPFLLNRIMIFEFVFTIVTGLGVSLLLWGYFEKLFGLVIPGCLLLGIGPGIYYAWAGVATPNGLTETGIMLVWFALGWGFITVIGRVVLEKFIWWPIIPGGVLAVVGCGLYIGGSPDNALAFIGNTGTIGLIIFGLYLLMLKRSFKG